MVSGIRQEETLLLLVLADVQEELHDTRERAAGLGLDLIELPRWYDLDNGHLQMAAAEELCEDENEVIL